MKYLKFFIAILVVVTMLSCKKYLDIVPDNIATIENSFTMRSQAEKYLFTCYSFLPKLGSQNNPTLISGGEFFTDYPTLDPYFTTTFFQNYLGYQNVVSPLNNFWDGENGGRNYWEAIRDCNIFLENINKVPDLTLDDKTRWIAEVKFLKAYYHYFLMRLYGPIPVVRDNLSTSSSVEQVKVKREPIDSVAKYIVELLDEAAVDLPSVIQNRAEELGRITKPIALSIKAEVLVTVASPLWNGNTDYANFKNKDGQALVNTTFDNTKWTKATDACKAAIDACNDAGFMLYTFQKPFDMSAISTQTQNILSIWCSFTEKWNSEIVWGFTNAWVGNGGNYDLHYMAMTPLLSGTNFYGGELNPTLNTAEMFYTENGVPTDEDKNFDYANRLTKLRVATAAENLVIKQGYTTSSSHYNRESRFYADLGFDGSSWFGSGKTNETSMYYLQMANNGLQDSHTGYICKKLVSYKSVFNTGMYQATLNAYPWPAIRLANLYLLYSEALNESQGPLAEAYKWIDLVRARAGLKGVVESWQTYSKQPNKPTTKEGFRDIIQRERLIETMFEGQHYYDLRRWKKMNILNEPVKGWDVKQEVTENFYRIKTLYAPDFSIKDYLSPIKEFDISVNQNMVQNPKW